MAMAASVPRDDHHRATAAGAGALATSLTLLLGGEATLQLDARVGAFAGTLSYIARLSEPSGYIDLDASDNTDTDIDIDGAPNIFRDGFEHP